MLLILVSEQASGISQDTPLSKQYHSFSWWDLVPCMSSRLEHLWTTAWSLPFSLLSSPPAVELSSIRGGTGGGFLKAWAADNSLLLLFLGPVTQVEFQSITLHSLWTMDLLWVFAHCPHQSVALLGSRMPKPLVHVCGPSGSALWAQITPFRTEEKLMYTLHTWQGQGWFVLNLVLGSTTLCFYILY